MKRLCQLMALVVAAALALAGCNSSDDTKKNPYMEMGVVKVAVQPHGDRASCTITFTPTKDLDGGGMTNAWTHSEGRYAKHPLCRLARDAKNNVLGLSGKPFRFYVTPDYKVTVVYSGVRHVLVSVKSKYTGKKGQKVLSCDLTWQPDAPHSPWDNDVSHASGKACNAAAQRAAAYQAAVNDMPYNPADIMRMNRNRWTGQYNAR